MTDARFPERWLNDRRFNRLSDREFRAYMYSLAWSVANKTDGLLEDDDLPLVPFFDEAHARVFARQTLWEPQPGGWFIVDFPDTQTSKLELDQKAEARKSACLKKRRQRERKKASDQVLIDQDGHSDESRSPRLLAVADVPEDVPRDPTRPGLGLGQGQARSEEVELTDEDDVFTGWSDAA